MAASKATTLVGSVLGYRRKGGGLTTLEVLDAGHLAPRDQPRIASALKQFMAGATGADWPGQGAEGRPTVLRVGLRHVPTSHPGAAIRVVAMGSFRIGAIDKLKVDNLGNG